MPLSITRIRDLLHRRRVEVAKDVSEDEKGVSLLRRIIQLQWPPRFIQNWRMAAMLTATFLVVLGIALWLCILIVTTVIGVRRGDVKLSLGRLMRWVRRWRGEEEE